MCTAARVLAARVGAVGARALDLLLKLSKLFNLSLEHLNLSLRKNSLALVLALFVGSTMVFQLLRSDVAGILLRSGVVRFLLNLRFRAL